MKVLLSLSFVTFFTHPTHANYEAARDAFCADPAAYVCKDAAAHIAAHQQARAEIRQQAGKIALASLPKDVSPGVQKVISLLSAEEAEARKFRGETKLTKTDASVLAEGLKVYLTEVSKLKQFNPARSRELMERIRQLHLAHIDRQTTFPVEVRKKMKEAVARIEFSQFEELFSRWEKAGVNLATKPEIAAGLIGLAFSTCNRDLLAAQLSYQVLEVARAQRPPEDLFLIYSCPGMLLEPEEAVTEKSIWKMAWFSQEIARVYSSDEFSTSYNPVAECLYAEFKEDPRVHWSETKPKEVFWNNVEKTASDIHTAEALAGTIEADGLAGTAKALEMIRGGLVGYCASQTTESHPSGVFRIQAIIGANPTLRKAVGCPAKAVEPVTCTLQGRSPKEAK